MSRNNAFTVFFSSVLVVTTMTALGLDRTKITQVCKDQRLWMDGSFSATVISGGLSPHSTVVIYKQVNLKRVKLDEELVNFKRQVNGSERGSLYTASNLRLFVPDIQINSREEQLGSLEANLPMEKISARLLCAAK